MTPKLRRNLLRIIPFGLASCTFGLIYALIERGLLGDIDYYPATGFPYHFSQSILLAPLGSLVFGLTVGALEVLAFKDFFKGGSQSLKVVLKTLFYFILIFTFLCSIALLNNIIDFNTTIHDPQVWLNVLSFIHNWVFWSIMLYVITTVVITLLFVEFSEYLGTEIFSNFFTGKYHKPINEERIFMFLDMRSSTTIAEQLGNVQYFEMLRSYYKDLSYAILDNEGSIYQYVGDEVIVSWKLDSRSANQAVQCFFEMQQSFKRRKNYYQTNYGLVPQFKAAIHYGSVTTGEIGTLKKDLTFTGDVLNTTARIQGLCNDNQTDLLLSKQLFDQLSENYSGHFESIGAMELRGKNLKVEVLKLKDKFRF